MRRCTLFVVLILAGCSTPNKREIKRTAVNTEEARLTGYLEGLQDNTCTPVCSAVESNVEIDEELVRDEATLVVSNEISCVDLVSRTVSDYDLPIAQLHPTCTYDSVDTMSTTGVPASVASERFDVIEYGGEEPLTIVASMTDADLGADLTTRVKFANTTPDRLKVVQRTAQVCCPGKAESSLTLSLSHAPTAAADKAAGLDFLWIFVE